MSFWTNPLKVVRHLLHLDDGEFSKDLQAAWDLVEPLVKDILKNGGAVLVAAAVDAVNAAQTTDGDKLDIARKTLERDVRVNISGLPSRFVNGLIELAVNKLNAPEDQPAMSVPPETAPVER